MAGLVGAFAEAGAKVSAIELLFYRLKGCFQGQEQQVSVALRRGKLASSRMLRVLTQTPRPSAPSAAKAALILLGLGGPAEVVPFQSAARSEFFHSL